MPAGQMW